MIDRDKDGRDSRRIIERVNAETEAHMRRGEEPASDEDWAEFWGRRIGRALSFVLLIVAVIWLYQFFAGTG